jgi:hypothetical protein
MIDPAQQEEYLMIAYRCGVRVTKIRTNKRIKLLEQRVIDLQGHDDLSYIDKKLSGQEGEVAAEQKKRLFAGGAVNGIIIILDKILLRLGG